jgi:glycogen debranching enzyme
VETLLGDELFCGWGIRTLGSKEVRYNPMAYHNGSIWPHDNSIAACGLARYGFKHGVHAIFSALLEASVFMELYRLPELFCGFHRRSVSEGPILYPVACSPQAWSAGRFISYCSPLSESSSIRFFGVFDSTLGACLIFCTVLRLKIPASSVVNSISSYNRRAIHQELRFSIRGVT